MKPVLGCQFCSFKTLDEKEFGAHVVNHSQVQKSTEGRREQDKKQKSNKTPPTETNPTLKNKPLPAVILDNKKVKITCGTTPLTTIDPSYPLVACRLCKFRTLKKYFIDAHLGQVHDISTDAEKAKNKLFSCIKCAKMFATENLFLQHLPRTCTTTIKKDQRPLFKCSLCEKEFLDKNFLQAHIQQHMSSISEESKEQSINCPSCGKTFSKTGMTLMNHIKACHNKEVSIKPHSDLISPQKDLVRNKANIESDDSGSDTSADSIGETGVEIKKEKKKSKSLPSSASDKSWICPYCSREFKGKSISGLRDHMRDIWGLGKKGPRPDLVCHLCDFKTKNHTEVIVKHLSQVHGEMPSTCEQCDFSSVFEPIMRHHVKFTHTCHKCPLCPFKTKCASRIPSHMFSKHNVKPTNSLPDPLAS